MTFLIGWLSIGGVPPFSGFWSKGDVLENAWALSPVLYVVAALTAVLTAYYLGRCYLLTFSGQQRWSEARPSGDGTHGVPVAKGAPATTGDLHPHDPVWVMRLPLVVLAGASAVAGLINLPFHPLDYLERWLSPVVGSELLSCTSPQRPSGPSLSVTPCWPASASPSPSGSGAGRPSAPSSSPLPANGPGTSTGPTTVSSPAARPSSHR